MVRRADVTDAESIARVHVDTWRTAYRGLLPDEFLDSLSVAQYSERWRRSIADAAIRVYVAEDSGGVVGFASGGRERAGENGYGGELYAIYVMEQDQHRGHGRELVRAMVGGLRELGFEDMIVWVLRDNAPARGFYERLGGAYVREQPITIGAAVLREVSYGWRSLGYVGY